MEMMIKKVRQIRKNLRGAADYLFNEIEFGVKTLPEFVGDFLGKFFNQNRKRQIRGLARIFRIC